ncbi:tRNA (5-methylaminomethyl-2-thiouridine)(34)-methyltransferase MnmD [Piscirickettsia litoralis]|uniref:MnmC-like methyltransferase domain-containing protein n=1 Tax=Piscirickettsia litoralis TaxID=1891921 RepID=A0ABX2ZZK4_9GAMM|nr:tRNA (5-methylaminomethyl-2-thiouridine)(34)-methyltransferase MnmD [Piscirickettsia litoralis]ODN41987.1 hypothetical protein BGC07_02205 [Piscirickettsia litoralis]
MKYAALTWRQGDPLSKQFDDIYYSSVSGLKESQRVFVEQSDLASRWALCDDSFIIAETGFGTGLNFLLVWQLWREMIGVQEKKQLNFVSVEKYPLRFDDLKYALEKWPSLARYSQNLLFCYKNLVPGENKLNFDDGQVNLILYIGDINDYLLQLTQPVDAWFLDGFAPSKNPEMWSDSLFTVMRNLTVKGGSFATFTAASFVRNALIKAGFIVEKGPGFAGKREMMRGFKKA